MFSTCIKLIGPSSPKLRRGEGPTRPRGVGPLHKLKSSKFLKYSGENSKFWERFAYVVFLACHAPRHRWDNQLRDRKTHWGQDCRNLWIFATLNATGIKFHEWKLHKLFNTYICKHCIYILLTFFNI